MKNIWICFLALILVFTSTPLIARGGGRGGGGRTPSMSRASASRATSRPQASRRVASQSPRPNRPSQPQRAQVANRNVGRTPSMSQRQQRPAASRVQNQANIRDVAKQYRTQKPFQGDISKVPRARQDNVRAALPQKFQSQRLTAGRVGDNIRVNHPNYRDWFTPGFNGRHDYTPNFDLRGNAWRRWAWNDINSWLGYGWSSPYYYDYGYPVELAAGYESYSEPTPQTTPPAADDQWLSLGVFAVGKSEAQASYSNMFVQLALSKQGTIGGTYYNATTDQTYAIDGYVDQATQAAFWKLSGQPDATFMTTGVFNLTQDVVPVTFAFSGSNDQNWVLVRVNE